MRNSVANVKHETHELCLFGYAFFLSFFLSFFPSRLRVSIEIHTAEYVRVASRIVDLGAL
jgi:hypothetical protein